MQTAEIHRKPVAAGAFYPATPWRLKRQVIQLLEKCRSEVIPETIRGLICPHAGYVYSGQFAAEAYHQVRKRRYEIVIIVSPSHFERFSGCGVFEGIYQTPLGAVPPASDFIAALCDASAVIHPGFAGHAAEHGIEVQLPFLQTVLDSFRLVPIAIGSPRAAVSLALAEALFAVMNAPPFRDRQTLTIASSDLSHYHSADVAERLDRRLLADLAAFAPDKLQADLAAGRCQACGHAPIVTVMQLMQKLGARHCRVLGYGTSGDINGDYQRVVGYTAAAFF